MLDESWHTTKPPSAELSQKNFTRFASYITNHLGIKMPDSKITLVQSRLMRRVRELAMNSVDEYGEYFFDAANEEERDHLVSAITTNKTDFFREPQHFNFLVQTVLPQLTENDGGRRRLNLWSAACSSGQEPFTMAMVLEEYARQHADFDYRILGTDVSSRVLRIAHKAVYEETLIEPVAHELRCRYLLRCKDPARAEVRIAPTLRSKVSFHKLNFMDADYRIQDRFDVVFCRNVLIYFNRPTQEAVICKICRYLNPGGYLFIGHSESLAGLNVPVQPITTSAYRKLATAERGRG